MSDDPLNQARRKLLASTSAMLGTLTAEDVGGTFRSIVPGLEAARATGRTSAVTAIPGLRKDVADGDEAQRKALDWQEAKAAELRAELAGLPDAPGLSRQRPRAPFGGIGLRCRLRKLAFRPSSTIECETWLFLRWQARCERSRGIKMAAIRCSTGCFGRLLNPCRDLATRTSAGSGRCSMACNGSVASLGLPG